MIKFTAFFLFLFFFSPKFILSAPLNYLPYLTTFDGFWSPAPPDAFSGPSSDPGLGKIEEILKSAVTPINYCQQCSYQFYFKLRATTYYDSEGYNTPSWYDEQGAVHAVYTGGKCMFRDFRGNYFDSGVAAKLQEYYNFVITKPDMVVHYAELRAGSKLSLYWWNANQCQQAFTIPSKSSCPNFRVRSLPVVRVRIRC